MDSSDDFFDKSFSDFTEDGTSLIQGSLLSLNNDKFKDDGSINDSDVDLLIDIKSYSTDTESVNTALSPGRDSNIFDEYKPKPIRPDNFDDSECVCVKCTYGLAAPSPQRFFEQSLEVLHETCLPLVSPRCNDRIYFNNDFFAEENNVNRFLFDSSSHDDIFEVWNKKITATNVLKQQQQMPKKNTNELRNESDISVHFVKKLAKKIGKLNSNPADKDNCCEEDSSEINLDKSHHEISVNTDKSNNNNDKSNVKEKNKRKKMDSCSI